MYVSFVVLFGVVQLLNAKPENVERESETVAQSGRKGAVTIATNMAGRGTDILLGGNSEYMARLKLREYLFPQVSHTSSRRPAEICSQDAEAIPLRAAVAICFKAAAAMSHCCAAFGIHSV